MCGNFMISPHITSDRGTHFTSPFWTWLCQQLKFQARMSNAYHPETDGQSERLNAVMEEYLRWYISSQQDDWAQWLPIAEFAANDQDASTTKATPFFANYGFHTRFDSHPVPVDNSPQALDANNFANTMAALHGFLQTQMLSAQDRYEISTNISRTPAPSYRVGDQLFLTTKNIRTARTSRKSDWKRIGCFTVKTVVSPYAYEQTLAPIVQCHPVFHVSLLDPMPHNPVAGYEFPCPRR